MKIEVFQERRMIVGPKQWRWRAVAANGRKVAGSLEGYNKLADLYDTLNLLRDRFPTARVEVEYSL